MVAANDHGIASLPFTVSEAGSENGATIAIQSRCGEQRIAGAYGGRSRDDADIESAQWSYPGAPAPGRTYAGGQ